MILFRALNNSDLDNLTNENSVCCTMYNHFISLKGKEKFDNSDSNCYYDTLVCFGKDGKVSNSLDTIIGHVEGGRLKFNNSPWISTSTNLDYVITEYAIPQSGNYNAHSNRKPVAVIDYDDNLVYDTPEKLLLIRDNDYSSSYAVDLRHDKLNEYVATGAIKPAKCNENLSSYDVVYDVNNDSKDVYVKGFAGYATKASEVLINSCIEKNEIAIMLYPFMQDILYGCNYKLCDIDKCRSLCTDIETLYDEVSRGNSFMKELYPNVSDGNNLTDYLVANYNNVSGNDIKEKYKNLKAIKLELLQGVASKLNMKLTRLVDDGICVACFYDSPWTYKNRLHDVVLVEKDGIIFKANPGAGNFVNRDGEKPIVILLRR